MIRNKEEYSFLNEFKNSKRLSKALKTRNKYFENIVANSNSKNKNSKKKSNSKNKNSKKKSNRKPMSKKTQIPITRKSNYEQSKYFLELPKQNQKSQNKRETRPGIGIKNFNGDTKNYWERLPNNIKNKYDIKKIV